MSHEYELFLVKKRLMGWGYWCYQIITMGLGYTGKSLMARLQVEGGMPISGTTTALASTNEEAEEINDLIERLAAIPPNGVGKPQWAKVLHIHYTMHKGNNKLKVLSSCLSRSTYYRYLYEAQQWLADQLRRK